MCSQAHEDRNLANKLTPAEKREKKIRKLTGLASEGEAKSVSVYRVNCSTTPQQNFKIRANAEVNHPHFICAMRQRHDFASTLRLATCPRLGQENFD